MSFQRMKHTEQCNICNNISLSLYSTIKNPSIVVAKEICHCSAKHSSDLQGFFIPVEGQCPFCENQGIWWMHRQENIMLSCSHCSQIYVANTWLAISSLTSMLNYQKKNRFSRLILSAWSFLAQGLNGLARILWQIIILPYRILIEPFRDSARDSMIGMGLSALIWVVGVIVIFSMFLIFMCAPDPQDAYKIPVASFNQKSWYVHITDQGKVATLQPHRYGIDPNQIYHIESDVDPGALLNCQLNASIPISEHSPFFHPDFQIFNQNDKQRDPENSGQNLFSICTYDLSKAQSEPTNPSSAPKLIVRNQYDLCFQVIIGQGVTPISCPSISSNNNEK